ncbi:hypothetical protein FA13DRAFT_296854 [Coprinellus micaceus]|uniref:Uncharacterized protein n=1 Tax=Coprinellus micaceus TaxID=71717 RepID=A0A4Y7SE31_COPMI|nr:hypothetical protein FA13DRAFT_296854 [Coprinellus micaceus]
MRGGYSKQGAGDRDYPSHQTGTMGGAARRRVAVSWRARLPLSSPTRIRAPLRRRGLVGSGPGAVVALIPRFLTLTRAWTRVVLGWGLEEEVGYGMDNQTRDEYGNGHFREPGNTDTRFGDQERRGGPHGEFLSFSSALVPLGPRKSTRAHDTHVERQKKGEFVDKAMSIIEDLI